MATLGQKSSRDAEREVSVILKAKDEAISIIQKTENSFRGLRTSALATKKQVDEITRGFEVLGTIGLANLGNIASSLNDIIRLGDTAIGSELFKALEAAANDALTQTNKISETFGTLTTTAQPFFEGFLGRTNKVDELVGKISGRVADFASELIPVSNLASSALNKIFEPLANVDGQQIQKIQGQLSDAAKVADAVLEKAAGKGIASTINDQLGGLGEIAGLGDSLQAALLDPNIRNAAAGNVAEGFNTFIKDRVGRELSGGIEELRKQVRQNGQATEDVGEALASQIVRGIGDPSKILKDQLLIGLSQALEGTEFQDIGEALLGTGLSEDLFDTVFDQLGQFDDDIKNLLETVGSGQGGLKKAVEKALGSDEDLKGLVDALGKELSLEFGRSLTLGLTGQVRRSFVTAFDGLEGSLRGTLDNIRTIPKQFTESTGQISNAIGSISGISEPIQVFDGIRKAALGTFSAIAQVSEQIFFFTAGMNALQSLVQNGPFRLLVQQNVELKEQLIATQSALVATNQVVQNGQAIADNTQAIQALEGPINSAIARLRTETLDLVGVTSSELVPIYQQVAGLISNVGGTLDDSVDLSIKFAATLGTLNIPLFQASEEIRSILQGTVDQNTQIAKSLGLTNSQLQTWISQGVIIDRLNEKLKAFEAGNALSARTLNGVTSNIQEVLEEVTRIAGAPLVVPIVDLLAEFYEFIKAQTPEIITFISEFIPVAQEIGGAIVQVIRSVASALAPLAETVPRYLAGSLRNAVLAFANAVEITLIIFKPFIEIFAFLARSANLLQGPLLQLFVTFKVLSVASGILIKSFGILANILPVVGEALFVLDLLTNGVVGQFTNLAKVTDRASGVMILLLKNLDKIPFAGKAITDQFGPLGRILTAFGPQVGSAAFTLAGLASQSDVLKGALNGLIQTFPKSLASVSQFTSGSKLLGGILNPLSPVFKDLSDKVGVYTRNVDASGGILQVFNEKAALVGRSVRDQIASFVVGAGAFAAFAFLFNEVIIKSEIFGDIFSALGQVFSVVGNIVNTIFNNPVGQAILLITGFTILLQTGLIPTLLATAKAMTATFAANTTKNIKAVSDLIKLLNVQFAAFTKTAIAFGATKFPILDVLQKSEGTTFFTRLGGQIRNTGEAGNRLIEVLRNVGSVKGLRALLITAEALGNAFKNRVAGAISAAFGGGQIRSLGQFIRGFRTLNRQAIAFAITSGKGLFTSLASGISAALKSVRGLGRGLAITQAFLAKGKLDVAAAAALKYAAGNTAAAGATLTLAKANLFLQTTLLPLVLLTAGIASLLEILNQVSSASKAAAEGPKALKDALVELNTELKVNKLNQVGLDIIFESNIDQVKEKVVKEIEDSRGFFSKFLDGSRDAISSASGLEAIGLGLATGVDVETSNRIQGALDLTLQTSQLLDSLQADTLPGLIKREEELATLNNKLAEARAKGNEKEVARIQKQIRTREDAQQREKDLIDETIRVLEAQAKRVPDEVVSRQLRDRIDELKEFRIGLDDLQNTKIKPPELPELGSALGQLELRAAQAFDFIEKGVGQAQRFEEQAGKLLEATEAQIAANAIPIEVVIERLRLLANSSNATAETQIKAQKLLTQAIKAESDRRIGILTTEQETVRNLVSAGLKDEFKGEQELTQLKIKELQLRRQAVIDTAQEEQLARVKAFETQRKILNDELSKAKGDDEKKVVQEKILQNKLQLERTAAISDRAERGQLANIDAQIANERVQGEIRAVDIAQKRALELVKIGTNQRLTIDKQLRNNQEITQREFEERSLSLTQQTTEKEIKAAQIKLGELNRIFKGKQVPQVRQQQLELQTLVLRRLDEEENASQKQIERIQKQITDRALASQNAFKNEQLELRRQLQAYTALEKSIENQNRLLNARKDLVNAQQGLFEAQANGVAALERSEFKRGEISQGIAARQIEITKQNIVLQGELLGKELERNRAALEREEIENRIATSQARASIAQAEANLARRREERDVTPQEIESLEIAIAEQKLALQDQLLLGEFLERKSAVVAEEQALTIARSRAEASTQLTEAQNNFNSTLRQGQQVALKQSLQQAILDAPEQAELLLNAGLNTKLRVNGVDVDPNKAININLEDPEFKDVNDLITSTRDLRDAQLDQLRQSAAVGRDDIDRTIFAGDDGRLERARAGLTSSQFNRVLANRRRGFLRRQGNDPFFDRGSNLGRKNSRTTRIAIRGEDGDEVVSNLSGSAGTGANSFQFEEGSVVVNAFGEPEAVQASVVEGLGRAIAKAGTLIKERES